MPDPQTSASLPAWAVDSMTRLGMMPEPEPEEADLEEPAPETPDLSNLPAWARESLARLAPPPPAEPAPAPSPVDPDAERRAAKRAELEAAKAGGAEQMARIEAQQPGGVVAETLLGAGRDLAERGRDFMRGVGKVGRGAQGALQAGGVGLQKLGGYLQETERADFERRGVEPALPPMPAGTALEQAGEGLAAAGARGRAQVGEIQEEGPLRRPADFPEDFWQGMAERPVETLTRHSLENLPQLVAVFGAAAAGGMPAAMGLGFIQEGGHAFDEAKQAGAGDEDALAAAGMVGVANMALEALPAAQALKRLAGKAPEREVSRWLAGALQQSASEGGTETLQEFNNILASTLTYAEEHEWGWDDLKRAGAAGAIGAVLGGGVGVVTPAGAADIETGTTQKVEVPEAGERVTLETEAEPTTPTEEIPDGKQVSDRPRDAEELGQGPVADRERRAGPRREPLGEPVRGEEPLVEQRRVEEEVLASPAEEVTPSSPTPPPAPRASSRPGSEGGPPGANTAAPAAQAPAPAQPGAVSIPLPAPRADELSVQDQEETARVEPWEMAPEELDEAIARTTENSEGVEEELFGVEGAKKYARLHRAANNTVNPRRADAAATEIERMEATLSEPQRRRLFGMDEEIYDLDELKDYRDAIVQVDTWSAETPEELGEALKWAVTRVGDKTDPSQMDHSERLAYVQLRRGAEIAEENGWDTAAVSTAMAHAAGKRFSDPEDARFMLQRFLPPEQPAGEAAAQLSGETVAQEETFLPDQPLARVGQGGFVGSRATAATAPEGPTFSRPEVEAGYQVGRQGIPKEPLTARLDKAMRFAKKSITRELIHLSRGPQHVVAREAFRKMRAYSGFATEETAREIGEVLKPLNDAQADVFTRKVLLDDLEAVAELYPPGTQLPFGITQADLAQDKPRIDTAAEEDAHVQRALDRHRKMWTRVRDEVREAQTALGMDTSYLDRRGEAYLHHQVIEHALLEHRTQSRKVKAPKGRGFQRELKGSEQAINLDYAEAQGRVLAQLRLDAEIARQLQRLKETYDIKDRLVAEAKEQDTKWQRIIPEGYGVWQPEDGSIFHLGQSVVDRIAQRILDEGEGVVRDLDLRERLMVGGKKAEWVLPEELVATLNEQGRAMRNSYTDAIFRGNRKVVNSWKKLMLFMPRRIVKYTGRNIVGDTQKTVAGNPRALKRMPQAAKDLSAAVHRKERPSTDLLRWMQLGGWTSGLFQQEITESEAQRKLRLRRATEISGALQDSGKIPARYMNWAMRNASFLEALNRYANFLEYRAQMEASEEGRPNNFGASREDEVMALPDLDERAYWLSNQLIGAYDQVSAFGQFLRSQAIPFWSFQELNVRSNVGLVRNAITGPVNAHKIAKAGLGSIFAVARTSPSVAVRAAKLGGLVFLFEATMHAWNYLYHGDEEDDLPLDVRRTPHIVFGRDSEGNVLYFNRLSVFHEAREWLGVDQFGYSVMDYLDGRITKGQLLREVAEVPYNKIVNAIGPVSMGGVKLGFELATEKTTFPNVRDLHDRWDYVYRTAGFEEEFRALSKRPTPSGGYGKSWLNAFVYASEPGAAAYYDTLSNVRRFLDSEGEARGGSHDSRRTEALRNYKRAIRYGQPEVAEKYLKEYALAGGTVAGFNQSLNRMDPMDTNRLPKKLQDDFRGWLTPGEAKKLKQAEKYYKEVFGPDSPGTDEALKFLDNLPKDVQDELQEQEAEKQQRRERREGAAGGRNAP